MEALAGAFQQIMQTLGGLGTLIVAVIVVVAIYRKPEILRIFFPKKGLEEAVEEKTSKDWFNDIVGMMTTLESNHLAHLQESQNRIEDGQKDLRETQLQQCKKLDLLVDKLTSIDSALDDLRVNGIRIKKN